MPPSTLFDRVAGASGETFPFVSHFDLIRGARFSFVSVSSVSIAPGAVLDSLRENLIRWPGTLTADITQSGPGGLQTGSAEAADTWYGAHIIGDRSGVNSPAALLIPDGTAFSEPGYDVARRVGPVRNNDLSNVRKFIQVWNGRTRRYWWDDEETNLRALSNGPATVFTAVSLAAFAAPTSQSVLLMTMLDASIEITGPRVDFRPTGSTVSSPAFGRGQDELEAGALDRRTLEMPTDGNQSIDYKNNQTNILTTIDVLGFDDEL